MEEVVWKKENDLKGPNKDGKRGKAFLAVPLSEARI